MENFNLKKNLIWRKLLADEEYNGNHIADTIIRESLLTMLLYTCIYGELYRLSHKFIEIRYKYYLENVHSCFPSILIFISERSYPSSSKTCTTNLSNQIGFGLHCFRFGDSLTSAVIRAIGSSHKENPWLL